MGRIQTGVDKLVALVKEKHKLSVDDAAKALGVSKTIIQEWADFLEEEGIVEIKYSFAKTYLAEKQLDTRETAQKERQLVQQRETFIGAVDQSIKTADMESKEAEAFRKELQAMRKDLSGSLEMLERDLSILRAMEKDKHKTSVSIEKQRDVLKRKEQDAARAIATDYTKYHAMLRSIATNEKTLESHRREISDILKGEGGIDTTVAHYTSSVAHLRERLVHDGKALSTRARDLRSLEQNARALRAALLTLSRTKLQPLVLERDRIAKAVRKLEERIIAKARAARAHAKRSGTTVKARRTIEELFRRKRHLEQVLETIEHDKRTLLSELEDIESHAQAYRGRDRAKLSELRAKLAVMERGKADLQRHLAEFTKLLA